jgi:phage-related protein (TIGR01555 family)
MSDFIARATDGLRNVVSGLATWRDKHSYSQYTITQSLSQYQQLLESMYRDSWLCKRIVNSVAEDMVREWITVSVNDLDDFDFSELEKTWKLKKVVTKALLWSRLFGGSAVIVGTVNETLDQPLNLTAAGQLQFLQVVDKFQLFAGSDITIDISSPNFDLPEYYLLQPTALNIHWSRVIRFDGSILPRQPWLDNNRWADSELQHVQESVKAYDSIKASIVSMFYEANVDVLKVDSLAELLSTTGGEEKVIKRFQTAAMMKSFNRVFLIDKDEEYEKKSSSFTNLSEIWMQFATDVSGACEIPIARLFGQSPGGIAATGKGELINYYDMVSNKQECQLRDQLETLVNLIVVNEYGQELDFKIEFNPLWQIPEAELAQVQKTRAEMDKIYYDMGVVSPVDIATELLSENVYSSLTQESIEFLDDLEKQVENEETEGEQPDNDDKQSEET